MKTQNHVFSASCSLKPRLCLCGLMVLVMGLWLTACKPDPSVSQKPDFTGSYTLVTINGNELPFTPPHKGGAPKVVSGAITLNADGTFVSVMSYGLPDGRTTSRDFAGNYTREGARLSLRWKGAGVTRATIDGEMFTMNNEGVLFAYRK